MASLLETYIRKKNNLFQSAIWQGYQSALERDTFWIDCHDGEVLVIKIPLIANLSYLYCPRAPQTTEEGWMLFLNRLKEVAKRENAVFVRVEPMIAPSGILKKLNFRKLKKYSPVSLQYSPMSTLLLDLNPPLKEIFDQMKSKWRYNIRLAEKKEIKVRFSKDLADLEVFYRLSIGMEQRGYNSHHFEHYKALFEALVKNNAGTLVVAEHEGEILSVLMVVYYNEVAIYLHGASSDKKRELMPNHLSQWEAIKEAKKRGCKVYDFWGIAPEGDGKHSWAGITRFKLGFGGERVKFVGAFDFTFKPIYYIIFCLVNFLRKAVKR